MEHWQITPEIVGSNAVLRQAVALATEAVEQGRHLLIEGEPGSGRRLLARCAWSRHRAQERAMLTVDCQTFGRTAVESLLFGPAAAAENARDVFSLSGGLLLLRVDSLPRGAQYRMAAALAECAADDLGGLQLMMTCGADVHPRLEPTLAREAVMVRLPPLRERLDDLPQIAEAFLHSVCPYERIRCSNALLERFAAYEWPGNIAELRAVLRRLLMMPHSSVLDVRHLVNLMVQDEACLPLLHGVHHPGDAALQDQPGPGRVQ